MVKSSKPLADSLKKAGKLGKSVTAVYDTGSVTSYTSDKYKGIVFIGFDGTYDPAGVMKILRSHLKSSRMVPAGPHGGQMLCGYDTSNGPESSECAWVTSTTFGLVEFIKNGEPAKQSGAGTLAVKVRDAVEVKG